MGGALGSPEKREEEKGVIGADVEEELVEGALGYFLKEKDGGRKDESAVGSTNVTGSTRVLLASKR